MRWAEEVAGGTFVLPGRPVRSDRTARPEAALAQPPAWSYVYATGRRLISGHGVVAAALLISMLLALLLSFALRASIWFRGLGGLWANHCDLDAVALECNLGHRISAVNGSEGGHPTGGLIDREFDAILSNSNTHSECQSGAEVAPQFSLTN